MSEELTKKVADQEKTLTRKEKRELAKRAKNKEQSNSAVIAKTKTIGVWFLIFGVIGFFGWRYFSQVIEETSPEGIVISTELVDDDWTKGAETAEHTLIEYGDFQCPACASYASAVDALAATYPDDLRIVYRHFPLTSIHANAMSAARAAEAAGKQGKFWEMHDILFARQDEWATTVPDALFESFASELGLDTEKYKADYANGEFDMGIEEDITKGKAVAISSTPTFVLDGKKINLSGQVGDFLNNVSAAIENE